MTQPARPGFPLGLLFACSASVLGYLAACEDRMLAAGLELDLERCQKVDCEASAAEPIAAAVERVTCEPRIAPPLAVRWSATGEAPTLCGSGERCVLVNHALAISPWDGSLWIAASATTDALLEKSWGRGTLLARGLWLTHYSADGQPLRGQWVDREFDPAHEATYRATPRIEPNDGTLLLAVEKTLARDDQAGAVRGFRSDFTQWLAEYDAAGERRGLRIPITGTKRGASLVYAAAHGRVALANAQEVGTSADPSRKGGALGVIDRVARTLEWVQARDGRPSADVVQLDAAGRAHLLTRSDDWRQDAYAPVYGIETYTPGGGLERELSLVPIGPGATVSALSADANGALLAAAVFSQADGSGASCLLRVEPQDGRLRMACIPARQPRQIWTAGVAADAGLVITSGLAPILVQPSDSAPVVDEISHDLTTCTTRSLPSELLPINAEQMWQVMRGLRGELYYHGFRSFGRLE